jgi:hypothetical protein
MLERQQLELDREKNDILVRIGYFTYVHEEFIVRSSTPMWQVVQQSLETFGVTGEVEHSRFYYLPRGTDGELSSDRIAQRVVIRTESNWRELMDKRGSALGHPPQAIRVSLQLREALERCLPFFFAMLRVSECA